MEESAREQLSAMLYALELLRFARDGEEVGVRQGQKSLHLAHYEQAVRACEETLHAALGAANMEPAARAELAVRLPVMQLMARERDAGMGHPEAQRFVSHLHALAQELDITTTPAPGGPEL